jgi:hypothetical protein
VAKAFVGSNPTPRTIQLSGCWLELEFTHFHSWQDNRLFYYSITVSFNSQD